MKTNLAGDRAIRAAVLLLLCPASAWADPSSQIPLGPRELQIAATSEDYRISNKQLTQLPAARDAFIANMQNAGSSTFVNGSVYISGQTVAAVPIVGGMVKDGIDRLHNWFIDGMKDEYLDLFDLKMKQLIYANAGAETQSLRDKLFPQAGHGAIDKVAADAFVGTLIGNLNPDYKKLPTDMKVELQRQAIQYLAKNFDQLQNVTAEVVEELNRQRVKVNDHSAEFLETEAKLRSLDTKQKAATAELNREGQNAVAAKESGDAKNAALSGKQVLIDFSGQAAIAKDQLDALASGLHAFHLDDAAKAATKASKACSLLASASQVAAGNYLAVLPAFAAMGGLFGSDQPDPLQAATQQILAKLDEIDRKIDAYHQEDLARFTGLATQLNEVLRAQKYTAVGEARQCQPWMENFDVMNEALVPDDSTVRVHGSIQNFSTFYRLPRQKIDRAFAGTIGKNCLAGLLGLIVADETSPGLLLDQVNEADYPTGIQAVPNGKRVAYFWSRTQKRAQELLLPGSMNRFLSTPAFGGGVAAESGFTELGKRRYQQDGQLYNVANLVTYASYAAAWHGLYAYYDKDTGKLTAKAGVSEDGQILVNNALARMESSIGQMRLLSDGPLLSLAYKGAVGELDSYAKSDECTKIVMDCAAITKGEGRKAVDELGLVNPWLEHNLGVLLIKRSLGTLTPSSYRFVVSFATKMHSSELIKAAFQTPLPQGFDVTYDAASSTFYILHMQSETRLPLADEVESGELTYPMTMLEAIRVEQQLIIEAAGYSFRSTFPDQQAYVAFARSGDLMPN